MQGGDAASIGSVRIGARVGEGEDRAHLLGRVPICRARVPVRSIMELRRAAPVPRRDVGAARDQFLGEWNLVRCRCDVQRGVARIDVTRDRAEEVGCGVGAGRTGDQSAARQRRACGQQAADRRVIPCRDCVHELTEFGVARPVQSCPLSADIVARPPLVFLAAWRRLNKAPCSRRGSPSAPGLPAWWVPPPRAPSGWERRARSCSTDRRRR